MKDLAAITSVQNAAAQVVEIRSRLTSLAVRLEEKGGLADEVMTARSIGTQCLDVFLVLAAAAQRMDQDSLAKGNAQ